jgi:large subunit ribosomal protein L22
MADEQLRQEKHGKQDMKPVKMKDKPAVAPKAKKKAEVKSGERQEQKKEDVKVEHGVEGKAEDKKTDDVKVEEKAKKKAKKQKPVNKHEAVVYGRAQPISLKHSKGIGKFIKNKKIEKAIDDLELVMKKKIAVPMTGELPHRKGKGIMSGKYPMKASEHFIKLLKSLNGNSAANGLELEKTKIKEVIVNKAPDQMHRFGRMKYKRTHVMIKSSDMNLLEKGSQNYKNKNK